MYVFHWFSFCLLVIADVHTLQHVFTWWWCIMTRIKSKLSKLYHSSAYLNLTRYSYYTALTPNTELSLPRIWLLSDQEKFCSQYTSLKNVKFHVVFMPIYKLVLWFLYFNMYMYTDPSALSRTVSSKLLNTCRFVQSSDKMKNEQQKRYSTFHLCYCSGSSRKSAE